MNRLFFLVFFIAPMIGYSQSLGILLSGEVIDAKLDIPLENANIIILETQKATKTNSLGRFKITIPHSGEYHFVITHIGCESNKLHFHLTTDTMIRINMEHYHRQLGEVQIAARSSSIKETISKSTIAENTSSNLSNLLENIGGVQSIKNGNGIAKPIIQGLYGNRLSIINNGIAQSGQQWGNDHAPEIDPLSANKIQIIKGVSSLEYKGVQMGAIVIVDPAKISNDPHLHGKLNSYYETNGRGFGTHIELEKRSHFAAWKLAGTIKKSGDRSTPDYYLRNTGSEERNLQIQIEKKLFRGWDSKLFLSSFHTELGILRGAHIGNLTDLRQAFQSQQPFFTEPNFTSRIEPPRQEVSHHLWKLSSKKQFDSSKGLELIYGGQINNRKEYDIRRSNRSVIPALYLIQYTNYLEANYSVIRENSKLKLGLQTNYAENINQPETGVTPLIPNYNSIEPGAFITHSLRFAKSLLDLGARYDVAWQNVYTQTRTIQRQDIVYHHFFQNVSTSIGYQYNLDDHHELKINSGFSLRSPAINELYSYGLHQGISSIEEGNSELKPEFSFKTTASISSHFYEKLFLEATGFFHNINEYIFLKPQNETRLTIRGAFPVFQYAQTHAQLYGFELNTQYELTQNIKCSAGYNFLRGWDMTHQEPLVLMPVNSFKSALEVENNGWKKLDQIKMRIEWKYMFRQNNLESYQDFIPAPDAYSLINAKISTSFRIQRLSTVLYIQVNNLLNQRYRDYLNRLRYFADEQGINWIMGLNFEI